MFYWTDSECTEFCIGNAWKVEKLARYPVIAPSGFSTISFMVPPQRDKLPQFCHALAGLLPTDASGTSLLWVMHWQDWGARANYHLYYRLRQSYHDHRELHQAPGHAFLQHETPDLMSFVELALLFGWDFQILSAYGDWGAYHDDELMRISFREPVFLDEASAALTRVGLEWRRHD